MRFDRLLEGKNAIITAGARGMGFSTARLFAQHGAKVAVCGRKEEYSLSGDYLAALSEGSFFTLTDMTKENEVEGFCNEALSRFGHIDIVVNVVGINFHQLCHEMTWDKYDEIQSTNIRSVITMNRCLLPQMIERGEGGALIHISTIHSVASIQGYGSYAVSKGGLNAYSRVMSTELGQYGIRSNVVCPGGVRTGRMVTDIRRTPKPMPEMMGRFKGDQPTYGPGNAQDIAMACLFFASPMSAYTTGCTLMVDGGASNQAHPTDTYATPQEYESILRRYGETFLSDEQLMGHV